MSAVNSRLREVRRKLQEVGTSLWPKQNVDPDR